LCTEDREDEGSHERGEEHFRHTILLGCFNQVKRKGNSREDARRNGKSVFWVFIEADGILGEKNKSGCRYDTIIPSVEPVAEIPGSSGTNVGDDSAAPAGIKSSGLGFGGSKSGRGGAGV
jgi:hypothetical protein